MKIKQIHTFLATTLTAATLTSTGFSATDFTNADSANSYVSNPLNWSNGLPDVLDNGTIPIHAGVDTNVTHTDYGNVLFCFHGCRHVWWQSQPRGDSRAVLHGIDIRFSRSNLPPPSPEISVHGARFPPDRRSRVGEIAGALSFLS